MSSVSFSTAAVPDPIDTKCATVNCGKLFASCTLDKTCRNNLGCVAGCWEKWDDDKTSQKIHIQNCTSWCTFSYENAVYDDLMECLDNNDCLKFPPIPSTCKNVKMQKNLSVADIEGGWWVLRGHNPVYDCYPCQKNYFKRASPNWMYTADYEVYTVNETLKHISQSGPVFSSDSGFTISFRDAGLMNNESWWVFDQIDDTVSKNTYFLVYYCGSVLQWNFEGAIVYSQSLSLADSALPAITRSYQANVGLDFSTFCSPAVAGCPNY